MMALPSISGEFGVYEVDLRFSQQGKPWVKARCVAKDRKRDQSGQWVDGDPCWLDVVAFGDVAEHFAESVEKGDTITVQGRLEMQEWQSDDGQKRTSYRILADALGVSLRWKAVRKMEMDGSSQSPKPQQSDEVPF